MSLETKHCLTSGPSEQTLRASGNRIRKRRLASSDLDPEELQGPSRTRSKQNKKGKDKEQRTQTWPVYFHGLYKIFKALNTVLAFCSSRKHMAITFDVVRSSVESLLKHPLELARVAELKALLPDLIQLAYIPRDQLRINSDSQNVEVDQRRRRERSPDYTMFTMNSQIYSPGTSTQPHEDEHVLVLDFAAGRVAGKKPENPFAYQLPPALTPTAVKKLVEKRNERFVQAVDELLQATPADEDPEGLLKSAAREHIPVNPNATISRDDGSTEDRLKIPDSKERESIDEIIDEIKLSDWYKDQITVRKTFDPKEARTGALRVPLSKTTMQALSSRNIYTFYIHQAMAIDAIRDGKSVIVSTSTASGKSIIYQVPMLRFLEDNPDSKAIYIYPTKALAQDQRSALEQLLWSCDGLQHIKISTYDGDTPMDQRPGVRDSASVIFTNFDMLHASILPHEENWRDFFRNLKLVAVDELHFYSGVFGTHAAYIVRRLRRVCAALGNRQVQFVSCSATIGNPLQHMRSIFGIDEIEVITDDGAPSGRKDFLLWNPPPNDPIDPSLGRHNSMVEATSLMRFLMKKGIRTILFCKYRRVCELAMKSLRTDLTAEGRLDILNRVMAYRGGYSQHDRRQIEREAFAGNLLGIVATNALELGVDIGVLDGVIMLGFPFGIANLRQQAGRAGRRARDSLAVLVADSLPLDQHYALYPNELFDKETDGLLIDLDSKVTLEAHLQCAAYEMPITDEDTVYFGPYMLEVCDTRLIKDKDGWYHTNPKHLPYPSRHVSIRGIFEDTYTVIDVTNADPSGNNTKVLEEIEVSRAMFETFEGAVFIHQGLTFIVQEVSHDSRVAKLIRANVNWTTTPRDFTDIDAIQTHRIREIKGSPIRAFFGKVELKTIVFGFFKLRNNVILDSVDLEMPPFERSTTGLWVDVPQPILDIMRKKGINAAEAIHAAEHAFLNQFPMAADVKTECKVPVKEYMASDTKRKRPARLIFYDIAGTQGAIAAKAFDHVSDLFYDAFEALESCGCSEGCDKCIRSALCKEGNIVSSKLGAQIIIRGILGLPIDEQAIPVNYMQISNQPDSIIKADPVRTIEGVRLEVYAD